MTTLLFMGVKDETETFRGRVYGQAIDDPEEKRRRAFVAALAGDGVLDAPAYDEWIAALQAVGWVPSEPELEPAEGGGKHARWRLTPLGRAELQKANGGDGR